MLGIHGTKAYLCVVKGYSRQGMSGKERSWFYFPVVLSRFCPVRDLYHDTWFCNIAEYQWFANDRSEKNALTTSNHQNGPCEPVKVASVRNSLVWKSHHQSLLQADWCRNLKVYLRLPSIFPLNFICSHSRSHFRLRSRHHSATLALLTGIHSSDSWHCW